MTRLLLPSLCLLGSLTLLACGDDDGSDGTGGSGNSAGSGNSGGGTGATGGDGGTGGAGATGGTGAMGGSGGSAPFELTSGTITDGGDFPVVHACGNYPGAMDSSPPMTWTAGPPGTMSYGIFFRDNSFNDFEHSAIWDIPSDVLSVDEGIEKVAEPAVPAGSKQAPAWHDQFNGYAGPCPGDETHTYQFELYALSVETLPDVTTASDLADVEAALEANKLESVTLTATFTPPQ